MSVVRGEHGSCRVGHGAETARRIWLAVGLVGCSNGGQSIGPGPATLGGTTDTPDTGESGSQDTGSTSASTDATNSDSATATTADGDSSSGGLLPPDYSAGSWVFENVSQTDVMSLHARRVVLDSGRELVAWAEVAPDNLSILNIHAASSAGGGWEAQVLTNFQTQNTFPTMALGEDVGFLAWTGKSTSTADYDVFFSSGSGAGWTTPRNLTDAFDPMLAPTDESKPVMIRRPGGITVAYTSTQTDPGGGPSVTSVYVSQFLPEGTPTSQELLIPASAGTCTDLTGAASDAGIAHFVARCGSDLIHATDRGGDWDWDVLGGIGTGILSPAASAGSDGEVHLVWIQSVECGTETCEDVFYARTSDGVFGTAHNASNSPNLAERMPAVGIDAWGRVLVLSQVRLDGAAHLRLAVAEDGQNFAESMRITPEGTADGFESPTNLVFGDDALPSFVFLYNFAGADPVNLDAYVGRFVP